MLAALEAITPNVPLVVSETANGETIILHHGTGKYFNAVGSGAAIWAAIEVGGTLDHVVEHLLARYVVERPVAMAAAERFIATLRAHDLVRSEVRPTGGVARALVPRALFEQPELGIHDDLADMLLLDPVHDTDTVSGWPSAAE